MVTELHQCVLVSARHEYNITAIAAVTAVGTALVDVLFVSEAGPAIAAVTCPCQYRYVIDKFHHHTLYQIS
jgi:predicted xylose isomerase-like sugar epimerase